MESNTNVLGENIKKKMEEKNLTTFELADRLKITTVELRRYITGKRVPKAPLIFHMARELDCSADELLGIEEAKELELILVPDKPTIRAVIEWLKCRAQNVTMAGARKMFQTAAAALEEQEQDKWIPCSVRPPENKKRVLVSYDTEDGKKVDISMFDKYGCLLGLVSAWRPLPAPYQEDEA